MATGKKILKNSEFILFIDLNHIFSHFPPTVVLTSQCTSNVTSFILPHFFPDQVLMSSVFQFAIWIISNVLKAEVEEIHLEENFEAPIDDET